MKMKGLLSFAIVALGGYLAYRIAVQRGIIPPFSEWGKGVSPVGGGGAPQRTAQQQTNIPRGGPVMADAQYQGAMGAPMGDWYGPSGAGWESSGGPVVLRPFNVFSNLPGVEDWGMQGPLRPSTYPYIAEPYA